jgi:hypothetical protein
VGGINLGQKVTGAVENAISALNGVTDAASAEAALPEQLSEIMPTSTGWAVWSVSCRPRVNRRSPR